MDDEPDYGQQQDNESRRWQDETGDDHADE
jgi:hypothetical protein